MYDSIILKSDSYKFSQWNMYPPGTQYVYSYIESRGGDIPETVFFGLQAFIREYLCNSITQQDIDEAEELILAHGLPFYREGWEYILDKHSGHLPVQIKAVPEGTVVPNKNVLATIVNTDPNCWWLTSFLETALLRAIWYPTTIASTDRKIKEIILAYLEETGDPSLIDSRYHDFGARGVSSGESAGIGGCAHLVNFQGTDTIESLVFARKYYDHNMAGFSIPATEHSCITSWGQEGEVDAYRNIIQKHLKSGTLVSVVSDSWDIFNACELWGTELRDNIINSGGTLVIRPDSGDPVEVLERCLDILEGHFDTTVNDKGYKVLNHVRLIQGDGIDKDMIQSILNMMKNKRFSADNIAFGSGGYLLQKVNRDTFKFAMKASAIYINGQWKPVYKDPVTDPGKSSKKGIMCLVEGEEGFETITSEDARFEEQLEWDLLDTVFYNGILTKFQNLEEIRERANKGFTT